MRKGVACIDTRAVEAGEMLGFKVVNIFPATCTDEDWADFADAMSAILEKTENSNRALA